MQEKLEKKFFPKFYILKWKKLEGVSWFLTLKKQKFIIFGSLKISQRKFDEILVGL